MIHCMVSSFQKSLVAPRAELRSIVGSDCHSSIIMVSWASTKMLKVAVTSGNHNRWTRPMHTLAESMKGEYPNSQLPPSSISQATHGISIRNTTQIFTTQGVTSNNLIRIVSNTFIRCYQNRLKNSKLILIFSSAAVLCSFWVGGYTYYSSFACIRLRCRSRN